VALKIIKNIDKYREAAKLEINVLNKLNSLDPRNDQYVNITAADFDNHSQCCLDNLYQIHCLHDLFCFRVNSLDFACQVCF